MIPILNSIQQWFQNENAALVQTLREASTVPATPPKPEEVIERVQTSVVPDYFPFLKKKEVAGVVDSTAQFKTLREFLIEGFRCYAMNEVVQLLTENGNLSAETYVKTAKKLQDFCLVQCFRGFLATKKFDVKQEDLPNKIRVWLENFHKNNFMDWDRKNPVEGGTLVEDFTPRYIIPPEVKYISAAVFTCEEPIRHVPAKLYKSIEKINLQNWQGEGFPVAVTNNPLLKHLEIKFTASQAFVVPSLSPCSYLNSFTLHGGTILGSAEHALPQLKRLTLENCQGRGIQELQNNAFPAPKEP